MRAALDVSWEALGDDERRALARCAVFRGGFDLEAAEAVLGAGEPGPTWAIDHIEALVRHHLVRASGDRYVILDSIAAYAAERLRADPGEQRRAEAAHGEAYAQLGAPAALARARKRADLQLSRAVRNAIPNLSAALDRAVDRGDADTAAGAAMALQLAFGEQGPLSEGLGALERAMALDGPRRLELQIAHARLQGLTGDNAAAAEALGRAMEEAKAAGEIALEATAALQLGRVVTLLEGPGRARAYRERARERAEACGDVHLVCAALIDIGYYTRGATRIALLERALALTQRSGERQLWFSSIRLLGAAECDRGRVQRSQELLEEALAACRRGSDARAEGRIRSTLGNTLARDDPEAAAAHFRGGLAIARRIGDPRQELSCIAGIGQLSYQRGDLEAARRSYQRGLDLSLRLGSRYDETTFRCNLGICLADLGRTAEARATLEAALDLATAHGPESVIGHISLTLSDLTGVGAADRRDILARGEIVARDGLPSLHAKILVRLSQACADLGQNAEAQRWLSAASDRVGELTEEQRRAFDRDVPPDRIDALRTATTER